MDKAYVHGYEPRERERLLDQAGTLLELLHAETAYAPGSRVLEVGCGVGAQTVTLARRSPQAHFTAIDVAAESIAEARCRVRAAGLANVSFEQADLFAWAPPAESFDYVFVCFVLEHLTHPAQALATLWRLLKRGGSLTAIEGDHGLTAFHPESAAARAAIGCQVELQRRAGGNASIGRQLYPLLVAAGFAEVRVAPRIAYADASRPGWVDGFTKKNFTAMIEGVREAALAARLIAPARFDEGVRDLHRTAGPDGVFCYTFFKAVGMKP